MLQEVQQKYTQQVPEYDGQHFNSGWCHFKLLLPRRARMFPLHGWLLSGVSEMKDLCLNTNNNTTKTAASL
jgi:hypothetical protein